MIEYDKGIHLKGTDLWFDSGRKRELSFVSSAAVEGPFNSEKIIATPETIRLLEGRIKNPAALACPYERPFSLGSARVELISSGSMLGSSQICVEKDGTTVIYAGDICLGNLRTARPALVRKCDVLVLKCTYAAPEYSFPPRHKVAGEIVEFVRGAISAGDVPVLLAESPGKAPELAKMLSDEGFTLSLRKSIYETMKIYEELGVEISNYEAYKPGRAEGRVVMFPLGKGPRAGLEKLPRKRAAVIAEFSPGERADLMKAYGADEAFLFSTRAGFDELVQMVELVRPGKVYLAYGRALEFAQALRKKGFDAAALHKPAQLKLL
ncbi:MAG TPA: MBL fold metallo-hydrolase [Thermodesulfobacteriota bacterium]|nr:MBL fold metallo-hydrolase [Thermodesulfobacteriota bacterium]